MKHTPGPWEINPEDHTEILARLKPKNPYQSIIAETSGYKADREGNAALIAAAPELLEALENLTMVDDELLYPAAIEQAKGAIKKARGEQ
jgi:nicotinic acid phosphoribosyltransferase